MVWFEINSKQETWIAAKKNAEDPEVLYAGHCLTGK